MKSRRTCSMQLALAGIAIVGMAAFGMADRAGAAPEESCGLGLPPGHPGFAEAEARREAEVRQNGYLRVCAANLERYHIAFSPMAGVRPRLAFQPVELAGTPFAGLAPLGGAAEAVNTTYSRVYRGFRLPGSQVLTLFEHDMSADGSSAWRDPKDEPERINGLPARLVIQQAGSGKAVSVLSWVEGRRAYELWIDANVAGHPLRDQLFSLATSLPASVPGCPKERPPRRFSLGPDGRPVTEPPPAFLTSADIEEPRKERPCK